MAKSHHQTAKILRPTLNKVDLVVSYPLLMKKVLLACKNKAVEHKFKTFILLIGFTGAYKFYGFFHTVKMMLNPLSGMPESGLENSNEVQKQTQSQQSLKRYLDDSSSNNKLSIEIFQKSINTVKDVLPNQISYICKKVVEQHFRLQDASDGTQPSAELSTEQKLSNWNYLTLQLLKTLFGEIYGVRIVNLIGLVQFTQGGKMFFQIEKRHSSQRNSGSMASSEEPGDDQGAEEEKIDRMKQQVSQQNDQFIKEIYQNVVLPVIQKKVLSLVDRYVAEVLSQRSMSPKSKITIQQFQATMEMINQKLLTQLFQPIDVTVPQDYHEGSEESGDERDLEFSSPVFKYYLSDLLAKQYDLAVSQGDYADSLKKELSDELMDVIETEYFAGALYELLQATFKSTIHDFLETELRQNPGSVIARGPSPSASPSKRSEAKDEKAEPKIPVAKLTTLFFKLQDQDFIAEQMSSDMRLVLYNSHNYQNPHQQRVQELGLSGVTQAAKMREYKFDAEQWKTYKKLLNQLVKFVFFGDERVYGIDMEDMMGDLGKYQEDDDFGMLNELLGGMGGGGGSDEPDSGATLTNLMKMIQA